jgi:hypothetical protein
MPVTVLPLRDASGAAARVTAGGASPAHPANPAWTTTTTAT